MSEVLFVRYIVRIIGPETTEENDSDVDVAVERAISEAEENISDLLPEGYYCKIEED